MNYSGGIERVRMFLDLVPPRAFRTAVRVRRVRPAVFQVPRKALKVLPVSAVHDTDRNASPVEAQAVRLLTRALILQSCKRNARGRLSRVKVTRPSPVRSDLITVGIEHCGRRSAGVTMHRTPGKGAFRYAVTLPAMIHKRTAVSTRIAGKTVRTAKPDQWDYASDAALNEALAYPVRGPFALSSSPVDWTRPTIDASPSSSPVARVASAVAQNVKDAKYRASDGMHDKTRVRDGAIAARRRLLGV